MAYFNIDPELVKNAEEIEKEEQKNFTFASGIYPLKINAAYVQKAGESDAEAMVIEYNTINDDWKFNKTEKFWYKGKDGKTTRMAKRSDGSEYPDLTFGMKQVNAICTTTGVDINTLDTSSGKIKDYNGDIQEVQMFTPLIGKTFIGVVQAVVEDKYSEPTEERHTQQIIWVGADDKPETEGFSMPWGRKEKLEKAMKTIDKTPVKDDRMKSKPAKGAATTQPSGENAEAKAAFGRFGR